MNDHECSYFRTLSGAMECACGRSYRPVPDPVDVVAHLEADIAVLIPDATYESGDLRYHRDGVVYDVRVELEAVDSGSAGSQPSIAQSPTDVPKEAQND